MGVFRNYKYKCETCNKEKSCFHSIEEALIGELESSTEAKLKDGCANECKLSPMYNVGEKTDGFSIGRFRMLSKEDKKNVLLKRSNEHFKREGAEYVREKFPHSFNHKTKTR